MMEEEKTKLIATDKPGDSDTEDYSKHNSFEVKP